MSRTAGWTGAVRELLAWGAAVRSRSPLLGRLRLSRLGLAWRPNPLVPIRRLRASGLEPDQPRPGFRQEQQRRAALALVRERRSEIRSAARACGVSPVAIAGALLWDRLEDPYLRRVLRLGPGRVRPLRFTGRCAAQEVERAGLITPARGPVARYRRLQDPSWAVRYIAAIMARHAENYRRIAGVEIGDDAAVLCTLYQGGKSDRRAARLVARRRLDPAAIPTAADEMGLWVKAQRDFIVGLLDAVDARSRRSIAAADPARPGVLG